MSISNALTNALSGLTANARALQVVSDNLSNLHAEGYARREIELTPNRYGTSGGVRVVGIARHIDAGLLGDRRMSQAGFASAETRAGFAGAVLDLVGTPDAPGSLQDRLAAFEASLVTAAARPEAADRLQAVSLRAGELAAAFGTVSDGLQARRQDAEARIAFGVETVNTALGQVQALNSQIADARQRGLDSSTLEDHRQVVIDQIAEYIPVREVPRGNGIVALMTPRGALLVDGPAATLEFTRANVIAPHMTYENSLLSGLSINGREVPPSGDRSPIGGGRLAALFELRDGMAVTAQAQVDALARGLVERFQGLPADSTLAPGDAGLFTDAGAAFDAADEAGLAGRLSLNAAVDVTSGGAAWRLRDGLGAAAPGPEGDARLLNAMTEALGDRRILASGDLGGGAATMALHTGGLASFFGQQQLTEDRQASFAGTSLREIEARLSEDGVDSDAETQRLLLIEQAYAANARMIETIDDMMQTLLRL